MKKYKLLEIEEEYRIFACKDIPRYNVKIGDIGGRVQSEKNLSQYGDCWIEFNSRVLADGLVKDNAILKNSSTISGKVIVGGNAVVCDDAIIHGKSVIKGDCVIKHSAIVRNCVIGGNTIVAGDAYIIDIVTNEGIFCGTMKDIFIKESIENSPAYRAFMGQKKHG